MAEVKQLARLERDQIAYKTNYKTKYRILPRGIMETTQLDCN